MKKILRLLAYIWLGALGLMVVGTLVSGRPGLFGLPQVLGLVLLASPAIILITVLRVRVK